ncbi:hypothetical protein [Nonomuraea candida]|uniref:hypothetical protein n=1 Tax=Nonomuraea candida TaxID=359159 RepID=UPI00069330C4|nr:hypothetical protein [Nonomuraea candida]
MTEAGTELRLGERAVLPHRKGRIAVTVTSVEEGDRDAFERRFGQRARGIVPYYIRYTVENVDGTDLSYTSAPYLRLVTADGRGTGAVVVGGMSDCRRESAPRDFDRAGATYETCRLAGTRDGVEVAGAGFDEDDYRDDPVVWRR